MRRLTISSAKNIVQRKNWRLLLEAEPSFSPLFDHERKKKDRVYYLD